LFMAVENEKARMERAGGGMEIFFAMAVKPFLLLACLVVAYPFVQAVRRLMPDGRLKRLLLRKIGRE